MPVFFVVLSIISFNSYAMFEKDDLKQDKICKVGDGTSVKKTCKDGDILLWVPAVFGNEQTPIFIIALFCDFSQEITYNKGGAACVFTTKRQAQWDEYGVE